MTRQPTSAIRPQIIDIGPPQRDTARPTELEPELKALAQWMDNKFEIPGLGIRFGLDAILGLIPGVGDIVTTLVSLYILGAAQRYGVARITQARMAMNIALDLVLGSVPFIGDIFDVVWKANEKNLALLQRHLLASPSEERRARSRDWLFVTALSLSLVALLALCLTATYLIIAWLGEALSRHA